MIVVVGSPVAPLAGDASTVEGLAARTAVAVAVAGEPVEIVGRVGSDRAGDALVLALGRAGVGHAALLRDPAQATPVGGSEGIPLDSGDVQLALQYLTTFDVALLIAGTGGDHSRLRALITTAAAGSAFAGAQLIIVGPNDLEPTELPPHARIVARGEATEAEFAARLAALAIA